MMDPSNVFKDAVDGLTAPNGSKVIPWGCLALIWYPIFSASCLPPKDDGSIKCLQRCSWRAVPGAMTALNGSNDRPWHCLIMTSHFQFYWQLACKLSSVYPQERRDPSNIFKDAVDELFQGFGNKISWHKFCLYLIGTLQIATDHGELVPEGGRVAFFLPDG